MNFYEILMKWSKNHKTLKHSLLHYFSFVCLALVFICKGYYATLETPHEDANGSLYPRHPQRTPFVNRDGSWGRNRSNGM